MQSDLCSDFFYLAQKLLISRMQAQDIAKIQGKVSPAIIILEQAFRILF